MLRNYLLSAFRNLRKNKLYSAINVFGLAIGLSCAMLILLFVKDEASYDRFHRKADLIYRVDRSMVRPNGSVDMSGFSGHVQGPRFAANVPGIRAFVRFQRGYREIRLGTIVQSLSVNLADSNFFSEFSFPLTEGNPKDVLSKPNTLVLTETTAKKYFGNADAVGKTLMIKEGDVFTPYTVSGVAKDCPANSSLRFEVLMPIKTAGDKENSMESWFSYELNTFVVLDPIARIEKVNAGMQRVFLSEAAEAIRSIKEMYKIKDIGMSYFLQPMTDIHLSKKLTVSEGLSEVGNVSSDYILSAIAIFVLLIACINFVNLTVARSVKRAKEIGVRKVIGGSRAELILQFFGESSVLCLLAFALAIGLVQVVLPFFNSVANKNLAFSYLLDARLIAYYVLLYLATSLLAGFYPALVLSKYDPVKTLYGRFNVSGKNYLQKTLVVLQFSLASFLVVGTVTVFLQFRFMTTQPLGYDDRNLVSVNKADITASEFQLFKKEIEKNSDILGIQINQGGYSGNTVKVNHEEQQINIFQYNIDTGFLALLNVPIVEGRNFSGELPTDSDRSVLVNETFVKDAGWKQPIGQQVTFVGQPPFTVVGVVRDYHFQPLTERIQPQLFSMRRANYYGNFLIKIRPQKGASALATIGQSYSRLFPMSAFDFSFISDQNAKGYEAEERWKQILLFGAVVTIFLSCTGLFGLSILSAEKRVKEIGIRKVLGASVGSVVQILSIDFLKLVLIALVISFPVAGMLAGKWLQNYPYRISLSWGVFVLVGMAMAGMAVATIAFQAIRAAIANPSASLRAD